MGHTLFGKPDRAKNSFAQLRTYLQRCVENPKSLNGRDVGRIRLILARHVAKSSQPGSSKWQESRHRQRQQARRLTFKSISSVVISRLEAFPKGCGIDDLEGIVRPITITEAQQWQVEAETVVPEAQQKKIRRCLNDTVDHLVALGVITSGEALACVLPQITS